MAAFEQSKIEVQSVALSSLREQMDSLKGELKNKLSDANLDPDSKSWKRISDTDPKKALDKVKNRLSASGIPAAETAQLTKMKTFLEGFLEKRKNYLKLVGEDKPETNPEVQTIALWKQNLKREKGENLRDGNRPAVKEWTGAVIDFNDQWEGLKNDYAQMAGEEALKKISWGVQTDIENLIEAPGSEERIESLLENLRNEYATVESNINLYLSYYGINRVHKYQEALEKVEKVLMEIQKVKEAMKQAELLPAREERDYQAKEMLQAGVEAARADKAFEDAFKKFEATEEWYKNAGQETNWDLIVKPDYQTIQSNLEAMIAENKTDKDDLEELKTIWTQIFDLETEAIEYNNGKAGEKEWKEVRKKVEELNEKRAILKSKLGAYRKNYGEAAYGNIFKTDTENNQPTEEMILSNLSRTAQLDEASSLWRSIVGSREMKNLVQLLIDRQKKRDNLERAKEGYQESQNKVLELAGDAQHEAVMRQQQKIEFDNFAKHSYLREYTNRIESLLSDNSETDPFKALKGKNEKENRDLFIALIGARTNNWTASLINNFDTADWKTNKKNYPFLFNAWIESEGKDLEDRIREAKDKADTKAVEAGLQEASFSAIVAKAKEIIGQDTFINNKIAGITDIGEGASNQEKTALFEKIEEAAGDIAMVAGQQGKKNILEGFEKLEGVAGALKRFYFQQAEYEKIASQFTRENLSSKPAKVLEIYLKQYQKAVQTVDSMGDIYDPMARRDLISAIFENGVATYRQNADSKEVFTDTSSDYYWMLSLFAKSPEYNLMNRGRYISPDQRALIFPAIKANEALVSKLNRLDSQMDVAAAKIIEKLSGTTPITVGTETKTITDWQKEISQLEAGLISKGKQTDLGQHLSRVPETDTENYPLYKARLLSVIPGTDKELTKLRAIRQALVIEELKNTAIAGTDQVMKDAISFPLEGVARDQALIALGKKVKPNLDDDAAKIEGAKQRLQAINNINKNIAEQLEKEKDPQKKQTLVNQFHFFDRLYTYESSRINIPIWSGYIKEIQIAIQNPNSKNAKNLLERLQNDASVMGDAQENRALMESFKERIKQADYNYSMLRLNVRSLEEKLETLGISWNALYLSYKEYLKQNPDVKVHDWKILRSTPEGNQKLVKLFEAILPENMAGGKQNFLELLSYYSGTKNLEDRGEARNYSWETNQTYLLIEEMILNQSKQDDLQGRANLEIERQMKGYNISDSLQKYAGGVVNMLIGPGQSWSNRAAGAAILFMAWKVAKKAFGGGGADNSALSRALRYGSVAIAAELAMKQITGRGISDRLGLSGVVLAIEGTFEAALVKDAKEFQSERVPDLKVKPDEQTRALNQLRNVPFREVLEWYESSDGNGMPYPEGANDLFPRSININKILPGSTIENKNMKARRIVKWTVEHFLAYVGKKTEQDATLGLKIAKERWVEAIQNPNFDLKNAKFTDELHTGVINTFKNGEEPTWDFVMKAEVSSYDAQQTIGQNWPEALANAGIEAAKKGITLTKQLILEPATEEGKKIIDSIVSYHGPQAKEALANFASDLGATIEYKGNEMILYLKNKKPYIVRFAKDHWELVKEGVTLPIKAIIGLDQWAIPWVTKSLRQITEMIRPDMLVRINGSALTVEDITVGAEKTIAETNELQNPYFGFFQNEFIETFEQSPIDNTPDERIWYKESGFKDTTPESNISEGIAYIITESSLSGEENLAEKTSARSNRLEAASREKAIATLRKKYPNAAEDIISYLEPIQVMTSGPKAGAQTPEKMYIFWRAPLPQSNEFLLKELGRYPDYNEAAKLKFRMPATIDPSKSAFQNFTDHYLPEFTKIREAGGYAGVAAVYSLRPFLWAIEKGSQMSYGLLKKWGVDANSIEWLKQLTMESPEAEKTKQLIDEFTTAAESTGTALSKFYRNPANAQKYKEARAESLKRGQSKQLDLSGIPGRANAVDNWYMGAKSPTGKQVPNPEGTAQK